MAKYKREKNNKTKTKSSKTNRTTLKKKKSTLGLRFVAEYSGK